MLKLEHASAISAYFNMEMTAFRRRQCPPDRGIPIAANAATSRMHPRPSSPALHRTVAITSVLAIVFATVAPTGFESGWLLTMQDDQMAVVDHQVDKLLNPVVADREIRAALDGSDVDLANSFAELAADRKIRIDPALTARLTEANTTMARAGRNAQSFARGLFTGEPDDAAALAGTAVGDLFVIGDLRDAAREGAKLVNGEEADQLILGLSCVGLAITAGTFASLGIGTPARVGVSLVKAARKTGRMGARLASSLTHAVRDVVDVAGLRRAFASASITEPAVAIRAAREAVKTEKAGGLLRVMGNIGTVQAKAGTQAALDGMRLAENSRDVSRLARLAEKAGGKTRAILKLAGRTAIAFTFGIFNLVSWTFFIVMLLWSLCSGVKKTTEHTTLRYVHWRKRRRMERETRLAMQRLNV